MTKRSPHMSGARRSNHGCPTKGFTLLETLLAITIFSFIAVGIATSFFSGMKLWGRAANTDFGKNFIMLSFESISGALRQSIDMPAIGFEGGASSLSFPAISKDSVVKVSYLFDGAKKMLSRKETSLKDIIGEDTVNSPISKDIVSLDEFHIQYLYRDPLNKNLEWRGSWKKEDGIFIAVRFTGKAHNEEFRKTVFIPIAQ